MAGMKKFAELVAAKSGGKMQGQAVPRRHARQRPGHVSALQGGTVEMAVMNTGILASVAKELAIFDFPFLFNNEKESDAMVDGPVGKKLHAKLWRKVIVGLSYWELGYRQITNGKRPFDQGRRHRGPEAARDPEPDQCGLGQGAGCQPDADAFPRGVRRAGAEGH